VTLSSSPYREMFGAAYIEIANGYVKKSSRSGGQPQNCVLCTVGPDGLVGIQDSKLNVDDRKERTLIFTPSEIRAFILGVKDGEFDYLTDLPIPDSAEAGGASLLDVTATSSSCDCCNGGEAAGQRGGFTATSIR
jgi:hypothetical protein